MKASVVVLTHNRLAALRECLTRIMSNIVTQVPDYELIVVNNGSTDGTREWLDTNLGDKVLPKMKWRTVIHLPENLGVCSRNEGIRVAKGEYIIQIDDDVMVMAGFDRILIEPMERDPWIGATGQEGLYQEQTWARQPWSAGLIDDRRKPQVGSFCDFVTGYCWAWRNVRTACEVSDELAQAIERTKNSATPIRGSAERIEFFYDEAFNPFWHEESDLQLQIRAAGYRIQKVRECAIHRSLHAWNKTTANEGPTAMHYAEEHFELLKSKWQNDPRVKYEGALVGLR